MTVSNYLQLKKVYINYASYLFFKNAVRQSYADMYMPKLTSMKITRVICIL